MGGAARHPNNTPDSAKTHVNLVKLLDELTGIQWSCL